MSRFSPFAIICALVLPALVMSCRKQTVSLPVKSFEEAHELVPVKEPVNEIFRGYYVALPPRYAERMDSFPLLVFLHGLGQMGDGDRDLDYVLLDGIGKLLVKHQFPVSFASGGRLYSFIVVAPQYNVLPGEEEIKQLIDKISLTYRVDRRRIYLSGLSMGAKVMSMAASGFADRIAAMVPLAGVDDAPGFAERCKKLAEAHLPIWELHNADDPMFDVSHAKQFIETLTGLDAVPRPRFTIFDVYGHDAWTMALNPDYRENGMNIYEWMLQYTR